MLFDLFVVGGFWFWLLIIATIGLIYYFIDQESGIGATTTLAIMGVVLWLFGNFNVFHWMAHHPLLTCLGAVAYFVVGFGWMLFKWELYCRDRVCRVEEVKAEYNRAHKPPTVTIDTITPDLMRYNKPETLIDLSEQAIAENRWSPERVEQLKAKKVATEANNASVKKAEVERIYKEYNNELWSALLYANCAEKDVNGEDTVIPHARLNHKGHLTTWMSYWPISMAVFFLHDFVNRICRTIVDFVHEKLQSRANRIFANTKVGVIQPK